MKENSIRFTKWVSLGWWASFAFFITQGFIIDCLCLAATPWFGLLLFASFTILTFASSYNKSYRFSPYRGLLKMLKKDQK